MHIIIYISCKYFTFHYVFKKRLSLHKIKCVLLTYSIILNVNVHKGKINYIIFYSKQKIMVFIFISSYYFRRKRVIREDHLNVKMVFSVYRTVGCVMEWPYTAMMEVMKTSSCVKYEYNIL